METNTYEPQRGLTFDDVWAALMETRKLQEENAREVKEYIREMKESARRLDKVMGDLGNRFGELAEHWTLPH
jgi:hypothetical protein